MVGRAHGHGIDALAHLVEHLSEVVELLGLLEAVLAGGVELAVVDVADGDHVARAAGVVGIALALALDADAGHGDFFVGRAAGLGLRTAGYPIAHAGGSGS